MSVLFPKVRYLFLMMVLLSGVGCSTMPPPSSSKGSAKLGEVRAVPLSFRDLQGWRDDQHGQALSAFLQSCGPVARKTQATSLSSAAFKGAGLDAGSGGVWANLCQKAKGVPVSDNTAARLFFENNFLPYRLTDGEERDGLFTGYYEATVHVSAHREGNFIVPIYALPDDWAQADLGDFYDSLKGKKITGRVKNHQFIPYDDRAAIVKGALDGRAKVLAWADSASDVFFMAIQGSGRMLYADGAVVRINYAAGNGQSYVPIGRVMAEQGKIDRPVTMAKIRTYLENHPEEADAIMNTNPSYIFYRVVDSKKEVTGPLGAMGIPLTPERSLAVDPIYIPLGLPVWIDTVESDGVPYRHLMMAQDTGGAIKGVQRGDIFWGFGKSAEAKAGPLQSPGSAVVLVPR